MNDFRTSDIATAATLLTRLPLPADHALAAERASAAVWAYPVVGAALGGLAGITALAGLGLGLPSGLAAALALAALAFATGALHEDGLADCADGIGGGATPERRLEIMKDSRIGAFGAVALILIFLARWSALGALFEAGWVFWPLVIAGCVSRVPMVVGMLVIPAARSGGMSAGVGMPPVPSVGLAIALGFVVALIFAGWTAFAMVIWVGLTSAALFAFANSRLGGQTGDVLGASQQVAEVTILAVLVAA